MAEPEVWLRGPVPGVPWMLQPVVHAFLQVAEDVGSLLEGIEEADLWREPSGAASLGFHCKHLCGSTDRLLTYARGEALSREQLDFMKGERHAGDAADADGLVALVRGAMERAIAQVRHTAEADLSLPREVGRAKLPTTVVGLVFHAAEHATRHAGQMATTVKVVRGAGR